MKAPWVEECSPGSGHPDAGAGANVPGSVARDRVRVQRWGSQGAVCQPGAGDPCPRQGSPGSLWPHFSRAVGPRGRKSAECLHCTALQRKQRDCWPGMSAWEAGRGGGEKVGSGPWSPSGGLWVRSKAGVQAEIPLHLCLWLSSSAPALPVLRGLEAKGDPEGPQAQLSAPEEMEHGAVSWAQTLTPGCRVTEGIRGSWRGLKAGLDASSCSAYAEPGQQGQRLCSTSLPPLPRRWLWGCLRRGLGGALGEGRGVPPSAPSPQKAPQPFLSWCAHCRGWERAWGLEHIRSPLGRVHSFQISLPL